MSGLIEVLSAGPALSVQDLGREGWLAFGLARGGAADRLALYEAAALLNDPAPEAALELAGMGGRFRTTMTTRLALTGAPMRASLDGQPLHWNASHLWPAGSVLEIGPADSGIYGYLSVAGGIRTQERLGARATQAAAGLGRRIATGDRLPIAPDPAPDTPSRMLPVEDRCTGGILRVITGPQTELFDPATVARFFASPHIAATGNRQGLMLERGAAPFQIASGRTILSEPVTPGDIQMTGAGDPAILLADCQTIGGYPRIGTVLPVDLPRAAQARPGSRLRFQPVSLEDAEALSPPEETWLRSLRRLCRPFGFGPDSHALLSYQLIGGVIRGDEEEPWRAGSI